MSLTRRGRSILALTTPSCGITFHLLKVERVFLLLRRANPKNQIKKQPSALKQRRLPRASPTPCHLAFLLLLHARPGRVTPGAFAVRVHGADPEPVFHPRRQAFDDATIPIRLSHFELNKEPITSHAR